MISARVMMTILIFFSSAAATRKWARLRCSGSPVMSLAAIRTPKSSPRCSIFVRNHDTCSLPTACAQPLHSTRKNALNMGRPAVSWSFLQATSISSVANVFKTLRAVMPMPGMQLNR
jgi:hypothetical protein